MKNPNGNTSNNFATVQSPYTTSWGNYWTSGSGTTVNNATHFPPMVNASQLDGMGEKKERMNPEDIRRFSILNMYLPYKPQVDIVVAMRGSADGRNVDLRIKTDTLIGMIDFSESDPNFHPISQIYTFAHGGRSLRSAEPTILLRSFKRIKERMQFKGKDIIPAFELAAIVIDRVGSTDFDYDIVPDGPTWYVHCMSLNEEYKVYFDEEFNWTLVTVRTLQVTPQASVTKHIERYVNAVRSMHFAIGLKPSEYKELP